MKDAHMELLKVLSECKDELRTIDAKTTDTYAATFGPTGYEYRKVDWGHVGDAKRLLADLKDIRRYWAPNTVAK